MHAAQYQACLIESCPEEMTLDLWAILSDKSSGEALGKIKNLTQGEGLWAYAEAHQWFWNALEQGRNTRSTEFMNPSLCKHKYEIAAAIESWEGRCHLVARAHPEAGIKWVEHCRRRRILVGNIDLKIGHIRSYDGLWNEIMASAISERIEKERGDDMIPIRQKIQRKNIKKPVALFCSS